jgi:nucleoside-diphosphate-sugar epimerase|tara:strand:+ start:167 stop:1018 length:852 start_codon:yes stop_codon:yes gene_type:complete
MNIAILGSAGQIGAYLKEYLKEKGHEVVGVDIVDGPQNDLRVTPNTYVEDVIKKSDFVFFLSFDVGGSRYLKKYQHTFEFINNNTRMMANTFALLEKYNKRFIFASSQMSNMSYSPYGVMKRVGELHTTALNGLIVKFWNVYGIEKDMEKAHVITDFIRKGFEEKEFEMMTDGTEERQFLYAEDCCEALEAVMENYTDFKPEDPLHITSFHSNTIREVANIIQGCFSMEGMHDVNIKSGLAKDSVQMDKRNAADTFILDWWIPKTTIDNGIRQVFNEMKKEYL